MKTKFIFILCFKIIFIIAQNNENQNSIKDSIKTKKVKDINEIVISGTQKPVSKIDSPVNIEVYSASFFKKNPTSNLFESLQNINGVRPQLNCNICNTGDIHINGLEGPYTMVTIDGMPIVSALSTVYGLTGIPNSLIDRVEIIKGPASSLYGSEAVGGLINIITKNISNVPLLSLDFFSTSWLENNLDLGFKYKMTEKVESLIGINYFKYGNPIDNNNDNFTDITLQDRISIFKKVNFKRANNKLFTLAGRIFYEDRWGGELQWNKSYRGGDKIYGESIYTFRKELISKYELPFKEKLLFSTSYIEHNQNSVYGNIKFLADQNILFNQLNWDKKIKNHDLLYGVSHRYQFYNDNTVITIKPDKTNIISTFLQDEIMLATNHNLLFGYRLDYNNNHGFIHTPRLAYRYKLNDQNIIRFNSGTGFRLVNLFTEEHASLTGSREVVVKENLNPERSINANLNYYKKIRFNDYSLLTFDMSSWYTYFSNQIIPDYDTNPNQIIYQNLDGYSTIKGVSINFDYISSFGLKANISATIQDVKKHENQTSITPILTENFSANWSISYDIPKLFLSIDYTGNLYSPMRLPLLSDLDPRSPYSPWWSIQNIQFSFKKFTLFEIYGGIKNILNWTPNNGNPFIISRSFDPFDRNVQFDTNNQVIPTVENPYALTFDPTYVYAPNQGLRGFLGIRFNLN